ncbi:MAG: hypothetical protein COU81_00490 [Candidatus Portnoybacteria bacterium CG10_big_fil_rev_8_21_14_0_10_36_7]|uniref:Bacterial type II secretion system protein E domain-containing protein n=1 Tax=Candidatus Portnoybacteria bacterium CG10_big_fil_rev_8_21_14_0_10_36_7 TaxID=1974812 RepID=A0A2M8KEZ0_9BACT|nr:MAG: hypothetical protein COU81_00490 [Candidatus Portnoybacteria bacterium CG10_big_fil_rev_8_21_14_0_10_36_7]
MKVEVEQLKAFLLDGGVIDAKSLKEAEEKASASQQRLEAVLVSEKLVKEEELTKLKAYILGIPFVNLEAEKVPFEVLQIIPESIARQHNIIAYKKTATGLEVAMFDPEDLQTIDFITKKADIKILPRLTSKESINNVLKQYQKSLQAEFGDIIEKEVRQSNINNKSATTQDLLKISQDLPVIRIVETLLKHAVLQHASDIHIEPLEKEVVVRYRIDGVLRDAMMLPSQICQAVVARIKVLANLKIDEHRLPQDGRFKLESTDSNVSLRVSILPVYDGEKIVMRLLFEDSGGYTLEAMGVRGESLEKIHAQLKKPHGMILVTGPTGSGKTTTLYTMMEILNTPGVNISTIEDPIEYRMQRINQTQVRPKIGLTFANGLRSLVRQDPDIIMVGEIRDNETAELVVNAALTGHLVLSTLHTNSSAGAMPRLIDMGVEPFLISSTINIVIAQRLVRRLCPDGREKYKLSKAEIDSLSASFDMAGLMDKIKQAKIIHPDATLETIDFFRPGQSKNCSDGYKGRIGVFEVLSISDKIREMVVQKTPSDIIEKQARQEGMMTMLEDGFIKAIQGITSLEEVMLVTQE